MSMREAWFWMLAQAAWKPTKIRASHGLVELQRGQFSHSLRHMAKTFGWSVNRVRRVLDRYSDEHMLVLETDTATNTAQCIVTICNYDKYQGGETATDTASTTQSDTPPGTQTSTIKKQETNNQSSNEDTKPRAPTAKSILSEVVGEDRAAGIIEYRQKQKKPVTARAAKIIAKKIAQVDDPLRAADIMIERCWQGFEIDWYENATKSRQSTGPPGGQFQGHAAKMRDEAAAREAEANGQPH